MNINDNNKYQLIDDYLKGGMSQDEIDRFKAFMQSDKDLALEAAITRELGEASSFSVVESQLRATLDNIRAEKTGTQKDSHPSTTTTNYGKIALVALLLAGMSYLLFNVFNPFANSSPQGQYQQMAMVEPLALSTKSNDNTTNLIELESTYNKGDYRGALPLIETYLKTNVNDLDVLLAKGIALTEIKEYRKAHMIFAKIGGLDPRVKKHLWFDAVAYVKEKKVRENKQELSFIPF